MLANPAILYRPWETEAHISPAWFAAKGGATGPGHGPDDTGALLRAFDVCKEYDKPLKVTQRHRFAPEDPIDLTGENWGFGITGTGMNLRGFVLDPGHSFKLVGGNQFYIPLKGFTVWGHVAGAAFQIGHDDRRDFFNELRIAGMVVNNTMDDDAAEAVRINGVGASNLSFVAECAGKGWQYKQENPGYRPKGRAIVVRHMFNTTLSAKGGHAAISLEFEEGYSFSNTLLNCNFEENEIGVKFSSPNAVYNDIIGGQITGEQVFDAPDFYNRKNIVRHSCNVQPYPNGNNGITSGLIIERPVPDFPLPSGGTIQDAQARDAIATMKAALQAHGVVSS